MSWDVPVWMWDLGGFTPGTIEGIEQLLQPLPLSANVSEEKILRLVTHYPSLIAHVLSRSTTYESFCVKGLSKTL